MAHCLFYAFEEHLDHIIEKTWRWRMVQGVNETSMRPVRKEYTGWTTYCELKAIGQRNVNIPTWGGIVPWVIWGLTSLRDLQITVQHDIWTPEHYLADATPTQAKIINFSDFGSRGITLAPAIYCDLDTQHAMFAEEIPDGNIVLAIQLSRKGD